jgi:hypothetical protein
MTLFAGKRRFSFLNPSLPNPACKPHPPSRHTPRKQNI